MPAILANVFTSPRTTFAGLWGVVVAPVIVNDLMPKVAAYLGSQPGLGWTLVGSVLALVVPALMSDKKAAPAS